MKIGFFDSGLGGLTILTSVRKLMPQYEYLYFGDTKNLPYGDRSEEEIYTLTRNGVEKLFAEGAVIVIVACNTASAASVRRMQDEVILTEYPDRKLLGIIIPTIETLLTFTEPHHALLIGTKRTIDSKKYEAELKKKSESHTLITRATPTLVPKIEAGDFVGACKDVHELVDEVLHEIDAIVLGCSHYTVLKECLRKKYPTLNIVSQDEIIPHKLQEYLMRHPEIELRLSRKGSVDIRLSAEAPLYDDMKKNILSHLM